MRHLHSWIHRPISARRACQRAAGALPQPRRSRRRQPHPAGRCVDYRRTVRGPDSLSARSSADQRTRHSGAQLGHAAGRTVTFKRAGHDRIPRQRSRAAAVSGANPNQPVLAMGSSPAPASARKSSRAVPRWAYSRNGEAADRQRRATGGNITLIRPTRRSSGTAADRRRSIGAGDWRHSLSVAAQRQDWRCLARSSRTDSANGQVSSGGAQTPLTALTKRWAERATATGARQGRAVVYAGARVGDRNSAQLDATGQVRGVVRITASRSGDRPWFACRDNGVRSTRLLAHCQNWMETCRACRADPRGGRTAGERRGKARLSWCAAGPARKHA